MAYVQTKGKDLNGIGDRDLVKYIEVVRLTTSTRT
jgi:hypothetical protein